MKKSISILFCLITFLNVKSQPQAPNTALQIGDKVPTIILNQILNYKGASSLSGLAKGRYVIIDFFATWCIPCVKALPELQALQKKFNNDLLILPVSKEKTEVINKFFKDHHELDKSMFMVSNESAIDTFFPHRLLPHEIWIDKDGYVRAITDGEDVNEERIKQFLSGKAMVLDIKKDDLNLDLNKSLLSNDNGHNESDYSYHSLFGKYWEGGVSGMQVERENGGVKRIVAVNAWPMNLYNVAFFQYQLPQINRKRIMFNFSDSLMIHPPHASDPIYHEWLRTSTYRYELSFNKPIPDSLFFAYMFEDLNRFFSFKGVVRKKMVTCYILYRTNDDDALLITKSNEVIPPHKGKIRNRPMSDLVLFLNRFRDIDTIIDGTGFKQNIDMDFDFSLDIRNPADLDGIRKTLAKYGLALKAENRLIDTLFLEDKDTVN